MKQLQWIAMIHMHFFTLTAQTHKEGDYCNFEQKIDSFVWLIEINKVLW
jgi:hypothetical protein